MASKIVGFNYDKLDAEHRREVQQHAQAINQLMERTATNVIEIQ